MPKNIISYCILLLLLFGCTPQTSNVSPVESTPVPSEGIQISDATALPSRPTDNQTVPTETNLPPTAIPTTTAREATPTVKATTGLSTTAVNTSTITLETSAQIVVDHTSVELFEQIPDEYLEAARNLKMMFSDRSVGHNINTALDCFTATSWADSPSHCRVDYYAVQGPNWLARTFTQTDLNNNLVPSRILFSPSPTRYNRSNWTYEEGLGAGWEGRVEEFVNRLVPAYVNDKDVLSYQFTYTDILPGSTIADPVEGFFVDHPHFGYYPNQERWDISDIEALESQYPNKKFIYWTTSLARGIGTTEGTNFNEQTRQYVKEHDKILFDVADILSRDSAGNPCYDNRDAVEFCGTNGCENHADDGLSVIAICQDYTTETDGGHLGSVSGGGIRVAKAFWVLMARIAGWNGVP